MKQLLSLLLVLALLLALVACGGVQSQVSSSDPADESKSESKAESKSEEESESEAPPGRFEALQGTDEEVELYFHLAVINPSINTEPTEENPKVFNSTRIITQNWCDQLDYPTTVKFAYLDMGEGFSEWLTVNYTAGTGPDLLYVWGDKEYADLGWYYYLDDVITSPNYYEAGAPVWKDTFADYLWLPSTTYIYDDYSRVIGVPIMIGPGPLTAYYYNTEIFDELGLAPTSDWDTFVDMCLTIKEAGYTAVAPSQWCLTPGFATWDAQFSITPVYGVQWMKDNDEDGDGALSNPELIKATYKGYYYLENNPGLVEAYQRIVDKFLLILEEGADQIDYTQPWRDGQVAMMERQTGEIDQFLSDTTLSFEWDMFPPPIVQNSEYVAKVEYTESGPYQPAPTFVPNVMNPELQEKPEYMVDYTVDYLKYLTTVDNLSMIAEECKGAQLGAVKGCLVPAVLNDWLARPFPILPSGVTRPGRPNRIDSNADTYTAYIDMLAKGMITMEEFIVMHDELMYNDTLMYLEQEGENLDISDWGDIAVPSCIEQN